MCGNIIQFIKNNTHVRMLVVILPSACSGCQFISVRLFHLSKNELVNKGQQMDH